MTTDTRPQELVERALAAAGGRGCAVIVRETSGVNLRWAMNGLTTNGLTGSRSVTVVVSGDVEGGTGVGVLTRQGIGADGVAELVAQAAELADRAAPAEDAGPFAGPGDGPRDGGSAGWDEPAGRTGASALAAVAEGLGEVFGRAAGEDRESFGFALHEVTTSYLGTSGGLRLRHEQPGGTIELNGKSHGRSRSTWVGRGTRDFTDVDVLDLDDDVRTRLGWQERRVEVAPGRHDTVLPPSALADLLIYLYWSSDARSAHEGRSVLSTHGGGTRLGERIGRLPLTLRSDPAYPGLECAAHVLTESSSPLASVFDNGLAAPATNWLDAGTVAALPATRHTAGLTGLPVHPTGDNLVAELDGGGSGDLAELVAGTDRGLLLTCLWYIREVDPATLLLTGLTRDGVYVVEGGEVVGATTNFRFNESPVDLLGRLQAVGGTEITLPREWGEWFTRAAMPPVRVEGFNMSTVSEAS